MPPDRPRRRITDNDRRRWNDQSLDGLSERVDRYAVRLGDAEDQLEALRLLPEVMRDMREDLRDMRARMDKNFDRNFREHREVKATADEIARTVTPSRLDWAVKFATIMSMLLVPFLLTYLTVTLAA